MIGRLLIVLGTLGSVATLASTSLSKSCPKYFTQKHDGLCYYHIRYLEEKPINGLEQKFTVYKDGFSPKVIDLGRLLFFDPLLSKDKTVSCASCHDPNRGFSDGRGRSVGVGNALLPRSAPTLWNVAFGNRFFWDGRAHSLEEQIRGPLFAPNEMGNTKEALLSALNQSSEYRTLFREAFHHRSIALNDVITALTTFERTLVSFNSRYDQFVFGNPNALTHDEQEGHTIFRSFVTRCTECHTPPLFTNYQMANIGMPEPSGKAFDEGLEDVTKDPKARGAFKVPTLRDIAETSPYGHSGVFASLSEVIHFYNLGAGRGPLGVKSPYTHWHMRAMGLSAEEESKVVVFLASLTDDSGLPTIPSTVPSGLPVSLRRMP